jgi:hypothetical protein
MMRILLQIVLPLVLPFVVYAAWLSVEQRRAEKLGRGEAPTWAEAPLVWLAGSGLGLALIATLGVSLLQGGDKYDGLYVPARVENGRIVPGHIEAEPKRP